MSLRRSSQSYEERSMERIEKTIEVDCPVRAVYNQWTQFEDFPQFVAGVRKCGRWTIRAFTGGPRSGARTRNGMP
jgi:uncharacterized membrane protein